MTKNRKIWLSFVGLALIGVSLVGGSVAYVKRYTPTANEPRMSCTSTATKKDSMGVETALPTPEPTTVSWLQPAIPEARRLTLEWPPTIRVGDAGIIRLRLDVDNLGNITSTAEFVGQRVKGEITAVPDLYETHNIVAEARLDMAGMNTQPAGMISEPLLPRQSVTFYWRIRPSQEGTYRGTIWLFLRFIPLDGSQESQRAISAQFVEVKAVTLFGITAGTARAVGAAGFLLGIFLGFPFIVCVFRWLWNKTKG